MKIVTKREQEEINAMVIKKLRFVAFATLQSVAQDGHLKDNIPNGFIKNAQDRAEQVFYADDVI